MDHARRPLIRDIGGEEISKIMGLGVIIVGIPRRRGPGAEPGTQLAADIVLFLAQVIETNVIGIKGMQISQHIDKGPGHGAPFVFRDQGLGIGWAVQRFAIDQSHDIEPGAGDIGAFAKPQGRRHGHRRRAQA